MPIKLKSFMIISCKNVAKISYILPKKKNIKIAYFFQTFCKVHCNLNNQIVHYNAFFLNQLMLHLTIFIYLFIKSL